MLFRILSGFDNKKFKICATIRNQPAIVLLKFRKPIAIIILHNYKPKYTKNDLFS